MCRKSQRPARIRAVQCRSSKPMHSKPRIVHVSDNRFSAQSSTAQYSTILYCTVKYCTVLYLLYTNVFRHST
jgi:hypothetical protein